MVKTLYITDLDGTLLNNSAKVSKFTSNLITNLTEKGAIISVATARTPATVEPILENTKTASQLVVMTGSAIWNRSENSFSYIKLIPKNEIKLMLAIFAEYNFNPFCYVLNKDNRYLDVYHGSEYLSKQEEIFVKERANLTLKGFHLGYNCTEDNYERVALFFGMGNENTIIDVATRLRFISSCYISYYKDTYSDDMWFIEIFAPGVSKASAMLDLKKLVKADRIVAFGDNLNDIPMLKMADVAVAVKNSLQPVKDCADFIIGTNEEDAVAKFIYDDFFTNSPC